MYSKFSTNALPYNSVVTQNKLFQKKVVPNLFSGQSNLFSEVNNYSFWKLLQCRMHFKLAYYLVLHKCLGLRILRSRMFFYTQTTHLQLPSIKSGLISLFNHFYAHLELKKVTVCFLKYQADICQAKVNFFLSSQN